MQHIVGNAELNLMLDSILDVVGETGLLMGDALHGRSAGIWSAEPLQARALVRPTSTDECARLMQL